jgi:membrane associated rhomboid family serine protease
MNRRTSFSIPGYSQNAVLQLIVACGVGFIMYHLARVTLIVFGVTGPLAAANVDAYTALAPLKHFIDHPWTLLTYGWIHRGFMEWVSNMVWLYCFGNVVQTLVGHKQVIPTFIYGLLLGGVFFLLTWLIPGLTTQPVGIMTANAGVMALAAGTITLAPRYRFYIGENFSIPLLVVFGIFLALNLLVYASHLPMLMMSIGGLLAGYLTMTALKRGFHPGDWMYSLTTGIGSSMTPNEYKHRGNRNKRRQQVIQLTRKEIDKEVTQRRVDEILEKIHQRGYASLTPEERDMLMQASKEAQD